VFNDLVYDPITAARQGRLYLDAFNSTEWDGTLNAKGFILNYNDVEAWQSNRRYTKGEIVLYKNSYWQASGLVQPKTKFDYNDWYKSNYDRIEQGLLPNLANKADQLANTYNIQTANLNTDNDLLAYNLIGFQPRQYMVDLNLDDVSQINLYQQFIKTKGSLRAAELLTRVQLSKETGQYNIYENWGILIGTYGASANRSYFEVQLNEALLTSDPSTIQVILPGESSLANQTVFLSDLWKSSYKLPSPNILTTTTIPITDTALPSAGYVNFDDVDITLFDITNTAALAENIDSIGAGTVIWVAKINNYDWGIYRTTQLPGYLSSVTTNLDGTSVFTFTQPHGITTGTLFIIRFFSDEVNGAYEVLNVPSATQLVANFSFFNKFYFIF
jgi:hypothetical protein